MSAYTDPEYSVDRNLGRAIRAQVLRDPCAYCRHRDVVFARAVCSGVLGRNFHECTRDGGNPSFELDRSTLPGECS
jgi:hypothetical protein